MRLLNPSLCIGIVLSFCPVNIAMADEPVKSESLRLIPQTTQDAYDKAGEHADQRETLRELILNNPDPNPPSPTESKPVSTTIDPPPNPMPKGPKRLTFPPDAEVGLRDYTKQKPPSTPVEPTRPKRIFLGESYKEWEKREKSINPTNTTFPQYHTWKVNNYNWDMKKYIEAMKRYEEQMRERENQGK